MGRLKDLFAGTSASAFVERASRALGAGKLEEAARVIERGLERHEGSAALLDLRLRLERARAHTTIRRLEQSIRRTADPRSYEELVHLFQQLQLPAEARARAHLYVEQHPGLDAPHLLLGAMFLDDFFEEYTARYAHHAHEHLVKAATLNAMAIQPRMMLAELYYCVGAHRALVAMMHAIEHLASDEDALASAYAMIGAVEDSRDEETLDGLFERVEVNGRLERAPETWPLSKRRSRTPRMCEADADPAVTELIASGAAEELVLLRRDGSVLSHAAAPGSTGGQADLVDVVRTVATRVYPQAREFDLGRFERCTIEGSFGTVVIGPVGNVLTGARGRPSAEAHRLWDQVRTAIGNSQEGDRS